MKRAATSGRRKVEDWTVSIIVLACFNRWSPVRTPLWLESLKVSEAAASLNCKSLLTWRNGNENYEEKNNIMKVNLHTSLPNSSGSPSTWTSATAPKTPIRWKSTRVCDSCFLIIIKSSLWIAALKEANLKFENKETTNIFSHAQNVKLYNLFFSLSSTLKPNAILAKSSITRFTCCSPMYSRYSKRVMAKAENRTRYCQCSSAKN